MTLTTTTTSPESNADEDKSSAIAQIISGRLYFTSYGLNFNVPDDDEKTIYLDIEEHLHYDAFYDDFGPVNLSVLYRFCEFLDSLLEKNENKRVFLFTSMDQANRVNAAYLIAAYLVIFKNCSAEQAYLRLQAAEPPRYNGFRDASVGFPLYLLHVQHVIQSVEKALKFRWLNFENFDPDEYEFYEKVENGDLNWIIPQKVLSFCGPHDKTYTTDNGYPYHSPEVYFDYFNKNGVTTIIRLNRKIYEASRFTKAGFDHHDLFFIDGTTPSDEIVLKFIEVVDNAKGAVAVHCKAGLGRTGTLIACWMMKNFRLTAPQCIGWLRICRPGSVIGPQQQFLIEKQSWCWQLGRENKKQISLEKDDNDETFSSKNKEEIIKNEKEFINNKQLWSERKTFEEEDDEKGKSQGDRLCEIKAARQHRQSSKQNFGRSNSRLRSSEESVGERDEIILTNRSPESFEVNTILEYKKEEELAFPPPETSITTTPIKQLKLSTTNPSKIENKMKIEENVIKKENERKYFSRKIIKNQKICGGIGKNLNTKIPIKKVSVSTNFDNYTIGGVRSSNSAIPRRIHFSNSRFVKTYLPVGLEGTTATSSSTAASSFDRALTRQYAKINANTKQATTKILDDSSSSKFRSPMDGPLSHQTNCKYELRPRSQLNIPSRFLNNLNNSQKQNSRRSVLTSKVETIRPTTTTNQNTSVPSTSVAAFVSRL